jgi:serine/threonine protein phosphatase PrpC
MPSDSNLKLTRDFYLKVEALSDRGLKREHNEDTVLVQNQIFNEGTFKTEIPPHQAALFVVCDGMGGHADGAKASQFLAQNLLSDLGTLMNAAPLTEEAIRECILNIHRRFPEQNEKDKAAGSTLCGLAVETNGHFWLINVGDSRLYRWSHANLEQISQDQKMGHQLLSAMGAGLSQIEVDVINLTSKINSGDLVLLCTDGLHGELQANEITSTLQERSSSISAQLLEKCKSKGARDNVSFILIEFT